MFYFCDFFSIYMIQENPLGHQMLLKQIITNFSQQKVTELQQSFFGAIKKLLESFFCEYSEASKYILIDCWIVLSHSSSNCQHTH